MVTPEVYICLFPPEDEWPNDPVDLSQDGVLLLLLDDVLHFVPLSYVDPPRVEHVLEDLEIIEEVRLEQVRSSLYNSFMLLAFSLP